MKTFREFLSEKAWKKEEKPLTKNDLKNIEIYLDRLYKHKRRVK